MLDISSYARKPFIVEGVRVTPANMNEVAKWCDGEIRACTERDAPADKTPGTMYVYVRVFRPVSERQLKAFPGDWVLHSRTGYKVYTHPAFQKDFDPYTDPKAQDEPAV